MTGGAFSEQDVIGHCKQCGGAYTSKTRVAGPTGNFCSALCKEKHEAFIQRALELESRPKPAMRRPGLLVRAILTRLIALAVLLGFAGAIGFFFNVPVLTPLVYRVIEAAGFEQVPSPDVLDE
jgi:hypothetical protein